MQQESHQMGLDTRETATPIAQDTGDSGGTVPAEPEWGGSARGTSCSPPDTSSPPACPVSPLVASIYPKIPSPKSCRMTQESCLPFVCARN